METPLTIKNKEVVKDFINALWVKRDLDIVRNYLAEDINYYGVRSESHGKEKYSKMLEGYLSLFSDVVIDIEDIISEKNKVYSRGSLTGILDGDFEGIKVSNKKVSFKFFDEMEIEDGKIKNDWDILDDLGLMQQLGMELRPVESVH
jgi:predicted ester cyclase